MAKCIQYKGKTYSQSEFKKLIESEIKSMPSVEKTLKIGNIFVTQKKIDSIEKQIKSGLPIKANDAGDLYLINKLVFGLNEEQSKADAQIMDLMIKSHNKANRVYVENRISEVIADKKMADNDKNERLAELEIARDKNIYNDIFYATSQGVPDTTIQVKSQTQNEEKAGIEVRKQALKDLMEATSDQLFIMGVADGTFVGEGLLNMNANGDVVLTRFADSEEGLTKGKGITENLSKIAGQFGGEQVATSGIEGGLTSFSNGIVGEYHIPIKELIKLIKEGYVVFAGLGNKEFVLSPHIADKYLSKINGKSLESTTLNQNQSSNTQTVLVKGKEVVVADNLRENKDSRGDSQSGIGKPQDAPHGAVQLFKNGKAIIYAINNPNVSTPLHELTHVFEQYLSDAERKHLVEFAQTQGITDKVGISEVFARGFEKYLADGVAPNKEIEGLFDKFKNWLMDIYSGVKNSPINMELNQPMKDIYAKMLGYPNPSLTTGGIDKTTMIDANGVATQTEYDKAQEKKGNVAKPRMVSGQDLMDMGDPNDFVSFMNQEDVEQNNVSSVVLNQDLVEKEESKKLTPTQKAKKVKEIIADFQSGKEIVPTTQRRMANYLKGTGLDVSDIYKALGKKVDGKTKKWVNGVEVAQKEGKMTILDAINNKNSDAEFEKLKGLIGNDKLSNHGTSSDVTAEMFFANDYRRQYFTERGVSEDALNQFLLNNRNNKSNPLVANHETIMDNYSSAFKKEVVLDEKGNEIGKKTDKHKEANFLGQVNEREGSDDIFYNEIFKTASRYIFDSNLSDEAKAYILHGTAPRTQQSYEVVDAFTDRIIEQAMIAAEEVSKGKSGISTAVAKQEVLSRMARMDFIYNMLSQMNSGEKDGVSVLDILGKVVNTDGAHNELNMAANSTNGIELILLAKVIEKMEAIGASPIVIRNAVEVKTKLATSYGRALAYLATLYHGKTNTSKGILFRAFEDMKQKRNEKRGGERSEADSTKTVMQNIEDIVSEVEKVTEESKNEFSDSIDEKLQEPEIVKELKDGLRTATIVDGESIGQMVFDGMTDADKTEIENEIENMADGVDTADTNDTNSEILNQSSAGIVEENKGAINRLIERTFKAVVADRIKKGLDNEVDNPEIKKQIEAKVFQELAKLGKTILEKKNEAIVKQNIKNKKDGKSPIKLSHNTNVGSIVKALDKRYKKDVKQLIDNSTKLDEIRTNERQKAANKLISAVGGTISNTNTTEEVLRGQVGAAIQRGSANKKQLAEARQEQIRKVDAIQTDILGLVQKGIINDFQMLFYALAQAAELGVPLTETMLQDAAYNTLNNKNAKSILKQYIKKQGVGVEVTKEDQIDYLRENLLDVVNQAMLSITDTAKNPDFVESMRGFVDNLGEVFNDAVDNLVLANDGELTDAEQSAKINELITEQKRIDADVKKAEKEDEITRKKLEKAIDAKIKALEKEQSKEQIAKEKAQIVEQKRLLKELEQQSKIDAAKVREETKAIDAKIKALEKENDRVERAKIFADEIDRREQKGGAEAIERELTQRDTQEHKDKLISDFEAMRGSAISKNMTRGEYDEYIADIINIYGNNAKGKEIEREIKRRYNANNKAKFNPMGSLAKNLQKKRKAAELAKKNKEDEANNPPLTQTENEVDKTLTDLENGDFDLITPMDLKRVEEYVKSSILSEDQKNEILALVKELKKETVEAAKSETLQEFAKILTGVRVRRSAAKGSKKNPDGARAQLRESLAQNDLDVEEILEARRILINTTDPSKIGEKLLVIDDMLAQIYGRTFGKSNIRAVIREVVQNDADPTVNIAKLLKDFYNNEKNIPENKRIIEQYIIESTGITDPDVVAKIVDIFNKTYDEVWDEERTKRLEGSVNEGLRGNLNRADDEVVRLENLLEKAKNDLQIAKNNKENLSPYNQAVNAAEKAVKAAEKIQAAARKNYETILKKAPQVTAFRDAMKSGMHKHEEFKEMFYAAFGLEPSGNESELERAVDMTLSEDENVRQEGFLAMRRLHAKYVKQGNFLQLYEANEMNKISILSGFGTAARAAIGGLNGIIPAYMSMIVPMARNVHDNLWYLIRGKKSGREAFNYEAMEVLQNCMVDAVTAIPLTGSKGIDIMLRGETDEETADELSKKLVHADRTIKDYLGKGMGSPVQLVAMGLQPNMSAAEIEDYVVNLSPRQRLEMLQIVEYGDAIKARYFENMERLVAKTAGSSNVVAKAMLWLGKNVIGRIAGSTINVAEFIAMTANNPRVSQLEIWENQQNGKLAKTIYSLLDILDTVAAGAMRTANGATILAGRALSYVDIGHNTMGFSPIQNINNYIEADQIVRDYAAKKNGYDKMLNEASNALKINPDMSSTGLYNILAKSRMLSRAQKKQVNIILDFAKEGIDGYTNAERNQVIMDYVQKDISPESLNIEVSKEFQKADKEAIFNILEGKTTDGKNEIRMNEDGLIMDRTKKDYATAGTPPTMAQRKKMIQSYVMGYDINGFDRLDQRTWKNGTPASLVARVFESEVEASKSLWDKAKDQQVRREAKANEAMKRQVLTQLQESSLVGDVEGLTGMYQRQKTRWISDWKFSLARKRTMAALQNDGTLLSEAQVRLGSLISGEGAKQVGVMLFNELFPLPKLLAWGFKLGQTIMPTNLWQRALEEVKNGDGKTIVRYKKGANINNEEDLELYKTVEDKEGNEVFDTLMGIYLPAEWDNMNWGERAVGFANNAFLMNGRYEWRKRYMTLNAPKSDGGLNIASYIYMSRSHIYARHMAKVAAYTAIALVYRGLFKLANSVVENMNCIGEDGLTYLRESGKCKECQDGTGKGRPCDPPMTRITGNGREVQGSDYERNAVQDYTRYMRVEWTGEDGQKHYQDVYDLNNDFTIGLDGVKIYNNINSYELEMIDAEKKLVEYTTAGNTQGISDMNDKIAKIKQKQIDEALLTIISDNGKGLETFSNPNAGITDKMWAVYDRVENIFISDKILPKDKAASNFTVTKHAKYVTRRFVGNYGIYPHGNLIFSQAGAAYEAAIERDKNNLSVKDQLTQEQKGNMWEETSKNGIKLLETVFDIAHTASGGKNISESTTQVVKRYIDAFYPEGVDDTKDIRIVKGLQFIGKRLADANLPLGGGAARDLNKLFGETVYENSFYDKIRNGNYNLILAEKIANKLPFVEVGEREKAQTPYGTPMRPKPIVARYNESLMTGDSESSTFMDEKVNAQYMGGVRLTDPSMESIARDFEGNNSGTSYRDYLTRVSDWDSESLNRMRINARNYKKAMLNDNTLIDIENEDGDIVQKSLKEATIGKTVETKNGETQQAGNYLSGDHAQYYDKINAYGNKRARYELLLEALSKAKLAPSAEDQEGFVTAATSMKIPTKSRDKEVDIQTTGIDGAYPNYSVSKLVKYIVDKNIVIENGVARQATTGSKPQAPVQIKKANK